MENFLNAVITCRSDLEAEKLLRTIKVIEKTLGRNPSKKIHWAPREIDIDIIAIENEIIDLPMLKIPHVEFRKRDFVLYPLREVAPMFVDPVSGKSIDLLIKEYCELGLPAFMTTLNSPRI
jgi:2-amino-4-hydroxy-6-hydroxymethyldihydropteridine diphosphokinase